MRPRYFIMVPPNSSEGVKGGPVQVDPETLHIGVLTEIYVRDPRSQQYTRAHGVDAKITSGVNASSLVEHWQDLFAQLQSTLATEGKAGEFADQLIRAISSLPQLIELIAQGKIDDATKALDAMGYGIMSASGTATESLVKLEARADSHAALASTMTDIVATQDGEGLYQATAEALAGAIDRGLSIYLQLSKYEASLRALYNRYEPLSHGWHASADARPTWLSQAMSRLGDGEAGFCSIASRYLISPDPNRIDEMVEEISRAQLELGQVEQKFAHATSGQERARTETNNVLLTPSRVDSLIGVIRDQREIVKLHCKSGVNALSIVSGLITPEEYAQWQGLEVDQDWQSLHGASTRIKELARELDNLFAQKPGLSGADQSIIDRAKSYIAQLEEKLTAPDEKPSAPKAAVAQPVAQAVAHAVATAPASKPSLTAPPSTSRPVHPKPASNAGSEVDPERLKELYELLMAIGYIKSGPAPLHGSSLRKMLRVLVHLGHVTEAEQKNYSKHLQNKLQSDCTEVVPGKSRKTAWEQTNPSKAHWIYFKQGKNVRNLHTFWRLVKQAMPLGQELCQKYGIDVQQVKEAYVAVNAEQLERRNEIVEKNT